MNLIDLWVKRCFQILIKGCLPALLLLNCAGCSSAPKKEPPAPVSEQKAVEPTASENKEENEKDAGKKPSFQDLKGYLYPLQKS